MNVLTMCSLLTRLSMLVDQAYTTGEADFEAIVSSVGALKEAARFTRPTEASDALEGDVEPEAASTRATRVEAARRRKISQYFDATGQLLNAYYYRPDLELLKQTLGNMELAYATAQEAVGDHTGNRDTPPPEVLGNLLIVGLW